MSSLLLDSQQSLLPGTTTQQRRWNKQLIHIYRTWINYKLGTKIFISTVLLVVTLITVFIFTSVTGIQLSLPHTYFLSSHSNQPTIYVSIASYRDPQCHLTIRDMYEHSEYPERIHVGIYQQHGEKEDDCLKDLDQYDYVKLQNIKIERVHFSEGRGPCAARYHCSKLYGDEDYYLQLDAHTRFIDSWDSILIDEIHNCTIQNEMNQRVVLSTYPLEYKVEDDSIPKDAAQVTTKFCTAKFNNEGIVQPYAGIIRTPDRYYEVPFVAGGFMFGPGSMIHDVPYDPDLPFLFHGEELMYSVRLYTAGYRMYGPRYSTAFHFYNRPTFAKVWVDAPDYYTISKTSVDKVKRSLLLFDENHPDRHGPVTTYTVAPEDVEKFYTRWNFNRTSKAEIKFDGCGG